MAQTLFEVQAQIAKLQQDAERLKKTEAAAVIAKMKVAIEAYGFTPADLFGPSRTQYTPSMPKAGANRKIRFADDAGNEWVGRGPHPAWLREAIANGASLSDFTLGRSKRKPTSKQEAKTRMIPEVSKKGKKSLGKKPVAVKYRDDAGNAWTGRGLQPRWLKAAIGEGKPLESFRV
jgi:DNA-binding protein H-NS